ncbi:MAG: ATP-binding protein [Pseudomonadota bacterium]
MNTTDSLSFMFPARADYLPIAVFTAKECAISTGFPEDDINRICLAIEETVLHALEFGYGGPQDSLQIEISRTSFGLRLAVRFHGLPLEIEQLPRYDPSRALEFGDVTGISLLLIEKMMDKASFSIQPGGQRTVSMEKFLPAQLASKEPLSQGESRQHVNEDTTLRLATPDDAEAISRMAFLSHGAVLFNEHIYYPDRVREMIYAKEMTSIVLETKHNHEVFGHGALVKHFPDAVVEEMTYGFVNQKFRSQGGASSMAAFLEDNAIRRGLYAIQVYAVTNYIHSQRSVLKNNYKETGLLVDTSPASHSWGKTDSGKQRIGNIIFVKYMKEMQKKQIFVPDHHRQMVEQIYAHHDVSIQMNDRITDTPVLNCETNLWGLSGFKEGWAMIGIIEYGDDVLAQVADRLKHACAQGIISIQLGLPLGNPATKVMTASFEDMGFFFAGVGPDPEGHENLILQYINSTDVDYDSIHAHSELAQDIKQYVQACDPRIRST